jgi:hypothetical protein
MVVFHLCVGVVVVGSWLPGVGCRDCRVSLSMVVVGSWLSGVGCRVSVVDYQVSAIAHFFHCRCPALCMHV